MGFVNFFFKKDTTEAFQSQHKLCSSEVAVLFVFICVIIL